VFRVARGVVSTDVYATTDEKTEIRTEYDPRPRENNTRKDDATGGWYINRWRWSVGRLIENLSGRDQREKTYVV